MELQPDLIIKLLTALGLGALIGAEREMNKAKTLAEGVGFAGPRTLGLVALLGFVGAYLSQEVSIWILIVLLLAISFFFGAQYLAEFRKLGSIGTTSEMAALMTFLIGVLTYDQTLLAVILMVLTVLILNFKQPLHRFVGNLESKEYLSAIKFIIVAFVILPLLPKEPLDPWGLISLSNAWLVVVLVSGISFIGYILVKAIGTEKGLGLTAIVGGLASSTATTISMAQQAKRNNKTVFPFVFAIVLTSVIMFGRALFVVGILNYNLLPSLALVLGSMVIMALVVAGILWAIDKKRKTEVEELALTSPFRLGPALQFGLLYVAILVIAEFGNRYLGESGVYLASVISGLADVDAITLSLTNLASSNKLAVMIAVQGISLAVMTNTVIKLIYVLIFGTPALFRWTALALAPILLVGGVMMMVI